MPNEAQEPAIRPYAGHDSLLEMWTDAADKSAVEIPVTLTTGGALVSGHIISASKYIRLFAEDLRAGFGEDHKDAADHIYHSLIEIAERRDKEAREEGEARGDEDEPLRYLHLRDVNVFLNTDTQARPVRAGYWRGRLDCVGGWFLGKAEKR